MARCTNCINRFLRIDRRTEDRNNRGNGEQTVNRLTPILKSGICAAAILSLPLHASMCLAAEAEAQTAVVAGAAEAKTAVATAAEDQTAPVATAADAQHTTTSVAESPRQIALASGASVSNRTLTPGAREAATLLGILPQVEKYMAMQQANPNREFGQYTDQELGMKVDLLDRIMGECLEVRVVADRIDRELAWSWSGKGMLEAKKQKILNYLFTLNFMQGGTLGVLSGPFFLHNEPKVGSQLLLLASSIGLGLSLISFYEARHGSKHIDGGTTVLADIYRLQQPPQLHHPEVVLKFLDSVPPGVTNGKTRREELIDSWKRNHYLKSMDETSLIKLAAVEGKTENLKESIGLMGCRIRMLFDCQWAIEQLDSELLDLLRALD